MNESRTPGSAESTWSHGPERPFRAAGREANSPPLDCLPTYSFSSRCQLFSVWSCFSSSTSCLKHFWFLSVPWQFCLLPKLLPTSWGCSFFTRRSLEVFFVVTLSPLKSYYWNKFLDLPWGSRTFWNLWQLPFQTGNATVAKQTLSWPIIETQQVPTGSPSLLLPHPSQELLKRLI